jgi:hypothetical protein
MKAVLFFPVYFLLAATWFFPPFLAGRKWGDRRRRAASLSALLVGFLLLNGLGLVRYGWTVELLQMVLAVVLYCSLVLLFTLEFLRLPKRK